MGYDEPRYHEKRTFPLTQKQAIAGTSAALVLNRWRVPKAINVSGADWLATLGGTVAAASTVAIGKSVGGTGTVSAIASKAFTTDASYANGAFTVTSTDFAAGDHLVVQMSGTTAAEHLLNITIEFVEDFG